jgi:hypothetical protein
MALLHGLVNVGLLAGFYYWLGTGESTIPRLLLSFALMLILLATAAAAYGSALSYFQLEDARPAVAWRRSFRNLLPLLVCVVVVGGLYWALAAWSYVVLKPGFPIASWLTLKLQRPVRPSTITGLLAGVVWLVRWVLLPVVLVPLASAVAVGGWRGFVFGASVRWSRKNWLQIPLLSLVAVWVPMKLIYWVPPAKGFAMEAVSLAGRGMLAYFLFVAAGLLLASVASGGKPRVTQATTLVSP